MDEIIVGTYEGFLLGYNIVLENQVKKFKQSFATHSHTASIRCISTVGKFLASGGTDDKVIIIDLKSRKEHTVLMNHNGTINTAEFTHSGTHLITGSEDGTIVITRTGNWQVEKIWKKAHNGLPVTAISIHISDKLALSIGGDKTLRTWNLIKGRPAFTINLASKGVTMPTDVKFSPSGDRFSLISQQNLDVWTISKAGMEKRITCNSKPSSLQWINDDSICVGLENGNIVKFDVSNSQAHTFNAHKVRVKCLHYVDNLLFSASSSGEVKVFQEVDSNFSEICAVNTGCRVTCITFNKENFIVKDEKDIGEKCDLEFSQENSDSNNEDSVLPSPLKRKPGAYVSVTYNNETHEEVVKKKNNKKRKIKK